MKKNNVFAYGIFTVALITAMTLTACSASGNDGTIPSDGTTVTDADATPITVADITITGPSKGAVPAATVSSEAERFTAGTVTWSPDDNPFKGGTVYTATVTLTAKSGFTFTGLSDDEVKVGGNVATTVTHNEDGTITLSYTFAATNTKAVSGIAVITQPNKLNYTHGDKLDLTGLTVTLTYDDTTTENVAASGFTAKNITTNPGHDIPLEHSTYNGHPVTISIGDKTANTNTLTVNQGNASTFTIEAIPAQTYNGSAITPTVTVKYPVADTTRTLRPTDDYTVTYSDNTNAGTATVTVTGIGDYTSTKNVTFTINKATPALTDFDISGSFSQTYDGSEKTVTVTAKGTITGMGTVTIKYNGSTDKPTNAGSYPITFDVAEGTNYTAKTNFEAGTLTINKATPVLADFDIGSLSQAYDGTPKAVSVTPKSGKSDGSITVNYSGSSTVPTGPALTGNGTYAVTFDVAEGTNYTAATGFIAGTLTIYFNTVATLSTWLTSQSNNNAATAYPVKLNVTGLSGSSSTSGSLGDVLRTNNPTKYVSIDLTGSTFAGNQIVDYGFYNCSGLTGITLPDGVTSIGLAAFSGCGSLASINIPNGVNSIGQAAFGNTNLTSIIIPASVTSIVNYAFYPCTNLTSVTFEGTIASGNFGTSDTFQGDLRAKYLDPSGGIGTYTRSGSTWTKQ